MKRAYQKKFDHRRRFRGRSKPEPLQLMLDRSELLHILQESVHSFGVEVGQMVATALLSDEVLKLCGKRHERLESRASSRHGHQRGWITIGGQKLPVDRPRVRSRAGGEIELESYALMQRPDAMPEAVLGRMVRGVSCRDYAGVIDLAREGFGIHRSSVSRSFIEASKREIQQLCERRFDGVRFPVILIDGVDFLGTTMIVVLGIQSEGQKRILGFREGATENAEVCKSLLEDLCERGLCREQATLFILDGSKALRKAVAGIWGRYAVIQRCQLHKKRNVEAHVPDRHWSEISRRLSEAYAESDHERAIKLLKNTAALLDRISPDAAASLREGMEETLSLVRLGVPRKLMVHLATTNIIESSLSGARKASRNVKRWRDGDMRRRWCGAGLLQAERKFRRVKNYRELPKLISLLDAYVGAKQSTSKVA